jgi:hypothetical protein
MKDESDIGETDRMGVKTFEVEVHRAHVLRVAIDNLLREGRHVVAAERVRVSYLYNVQGCGG